MRIAEKLSAYLFKLGAGLLEVVLRLGVKVMRVLALVEHRHEVRHALAKRLGKRFEALMLGLQHLVAVTERVLLDQLELVAGHFVRGGLQLGQQLV